MDVLAVIKELQTVVPPDDIFQKELEEFIRVDSYAPAWRKYEVLTHLSERTHHYMGRDQYPHSEEWKQKACGVLTKAFYEVHKDKI